MDSSHRSALIAITEKEYIFQTFAFFKKKKYIHIPSRVYFLTRNNCSKKKKHPNWSEFFLVSQAISIVLAFVIQVSEYSLRDVTIIRKYIGVKSCKNICFTTESFIGKGRLKRKRLQKRRNNTKVLFL